MLKTIAQTISVYPDVVERDEGATKKEVESMIRLCDQLQILIHDDLANVFKRKSE